MDATNQFAPACACETAPCQSSLKPARAGVTFIYVLRDPRTLEIRYVGKSDNPTRRLWDHVGKRIREKNRKANWIKSLKAQGLKPTLEIIDEVHPVEWQAVEAAYIQFFTEQGCRLVNGTLGGDGTGAGKDSPNYGRSVSPEQRARLRQAWVNLPPEKKAARIAAHKTPESRAKIRASLLGIKRPLEVVAKTRETKRNKSLEQQAELRAKLSRAASTPEHLEKKRARVKRWWDQKKRRQSSEQGQLELWK